MSNVRLDDADPVEQRDAPSLQEALGVGPNDGPRPLTIAEYRARQERRKTITKNKKRSGQRINLLQQRRLIKDYLNAASTLEEIKEHEKNVAIIEKELCKRAK